MLKLDINGVHTELDAKLKKYVSKKIGRLDRFLSKSARVSVKTEVFLKEVGQKRNTRYTCEVVMQLPGQRLAAKETTVNHFAAVDIVETKLKNQLRKYKDAHSTKRIHRRVLARLKRQRNQ